MPYKFIPLQNDVAGGQERWLVLQQQTDGSFLFVGVANQQNPNFDLLSNTGLTLSTAGVTDAADKRFLTDLQLSGLVTLQPLVAVEAQLLKVGGNTGCDSLLATVDLVDMNAAGATLLYTVAAGKSCVITKVVVRESSGNLTTASICFGFTGAGFTDVIDTATHVELTGATLATVLFPKVGALVGLSTNTFKVLDTILQGAAMTVSIDVFGLLF